MEAAIPLAQFKEAAADAERTWQASRAQGADAEAATAQVSLTVARLELGELDAVRGLAVEAARACADVGDVQGRLMSEAALALARVLSGHPAEALAPLERLEQSLPGAAPELVAAVSPYVVTALAGLGRLERALEVAQEAMFAHRSLDAPALRAALEAAMADVQAQRGAYELARGFVSTAINGASDFGARGTLAKALRVRARVAIAEKQLDEAQKAAEQAYAMAMQQGATVQAALSVGLLAEALALRTDASARGHFQTMQALADQAGAPLLRAHALAGQARMAPAAAGAEQLVRDARRTLETIAATLGSQDRERFLALPEHAALLTLELAVPVPPPTFHDHQAMLDLLVRANADLHSVTNQYERLFKEWNAKSQRLEWLNGLAAAISSSLDIDEVVTRVIGLTLEITRAQRCFVLFKESGHFEGLLVRAARDVHGKDVRDARFSLSVCLRVHQSGEPTTILDASGTGADLSQSIQALNLQTVMCVPLLCREKRLGVIYVDSQAAVKTFAADDLALLSAIANHAAVAIDNALMYEGLNARMGDLEAALERAREADRVATTDALTGLRNRRYLAESAVRELDIARRYNRDVSLVMIDIDHFKSFNDRFGHAVGDEALRAMAGVLATHCRQGDLAARLGGEEFVVLCPSSSPSEAASLAERLRESTASVRLNGLDGETLTASFGIASVRQGASSMDELLERADLALYAAKQGGRNQVRIWQPPAGEL